MSEKWRESWLEGDTKIRFVTMPKHIKLWYSKAHKYVHVDFDLYPTEYQLTEEGTKQVWKLYSEVADKKSSIIISPLTAHLRIPIEHLEHAILKLMEILPNNLEEDPELKKFKQDFPKNEICKCITETEKKTKKEVCIGKVFGNAIFEQIQTETGNYAYSLYQQMPDDSWQLDTRPIYEGFIPLSRTPLIHPPAPTEYENEEQLYNNIRTYIQKHVDLVNPLAYDILASFVLSTWTPELFDFTCYLMFYGREASGKSRALEVLRELCFRSWFSTGLTVATLFRLVEKFTPTLLLDESEFLTAEERKELISLLNAGQRKGITVPRMRGERFEEVEFFSVYCPKALAGTETLKATTTSRMIVFTMTKNIKPVPRTLDKKESAKLRSQLLMWRFKTIAKLKDSLTLQQKLAMTELKATTEFKELEPLSGRTFELFYPLYYSAPPTARPNILEFAKELEQSKLQAEKTELASMVFEAIINLKDRKAYKGILLLADIAQYINSDQPIQYWIPEKTIAKKCRQMGLETTRTNRGTAILLNTQIIERLKLDPRYSTDLLNYGEDVKEMKGKGVSNWVDR